MREIEFRAWHKNAKYMCNNATTDLLGRDYLEFMQYVGLKDKNGKKIFEGDILKVYDDFFREGLDDLYGVVKFNNGRFYLNTFKSYPNECWVYFEVVGNVYENEDSLHNI